MIEGIFLQLKVMHVHPSPIQSSRSQLIAVLVGFVVVDALLICCCLCLWCLASFGLIFVYDLWTLFSVLGYSLNSHTVSCRHQERDVLVHSNPCPAAEGHRVLSLGKRPKTSVAQHRPRQWSSSSHWLMGEGKWNWNWVVLPPLVCCNCCVVIWLMDQISPSTTLGELKHQGQSISLHQAYDWSLQYILQFVRELVNVFENEKCLILCFISTSESWVTFFFRV